MINEHVNDSQLKNCFPQNDIKVMFHMDKISYFVYSCMLYYLIIRSIF